MSEKNIARREKLVKLTAVAGLSAAALTGFNVYNGQAAENLEKDQQRAAKIVEEDMRNVAASVTDRLKQSGAECAVRTDEKCFLDARSENGQSHWQFSYDPKDSTMNFGADVSFTSDTMGEVHKGYTITFELNDSLMAGSKVGAAQLPELLTEASPRSVNISATSSEVTAIDMAEFDEQGKVVDVRSHKVIAGNGFKHDTLDLFTQQINAHAQ